MNSCIRREGEDWILQVRVQPRASRDELLEDGERLRLRITSPPVDGAANAHIIRFLAREFGVAKGRVEIVRGLAGREKTVRISAPTAIPNTVTRLFSQG